MQQTFIDVATISDLHRLYSCPPPKHPLVSFLSLQEISRDQFSETEQAYRLGFYAVYLKQLKGSMKYGRSQYDFDEGTLVFTAPGQAISTQRRLSYNEGWGLFFHPGLLYRTALGRKINGYSFFNYDVHESLHISDEEKKILRDCCEHIKREYTQQLDKHTGDLIVSHIELLLNYCSRFYDRQFLARASVSHDVVQQFETLLRDYFSRDTLIEDGLPDVGYFADRLHLSPNYLSDLLNKYTGKTTQEHIHLQLVEQAKHLLLGSGSSISEIAFTLGFEHPSHFTRVFKNKTGLSPKAFRAG
ncbi:helix-turn-helix domain-containing protein [Taibaiella chishuiensis]|uniref:AraC family transcriptional regulator n=1 Tax=Taibaiella chishuiensis TaxID=1434707 RepID=A0A2P8D7P1_9BACT|nr:helix-turn-helix domain-containing protein [Taibaiella chishuiensis]PSK93246.1 AraC family transcriptional regulator [Taibaiella chishuiensis]